MAEPEQTPGSPGPEMAFGAPGARRLPGALESAAVAGLPEVLAGVGPFDAAPPPDVTVGGGSAAAWDGLATHAAATGDGPEADARGADDDVIELTVPALNGYLAVVRTATAGLAARLSFTLDEIEDLRIAVDEACVMLLGLPGPAAGEPATLTCQFRVSPEVLAVTVSADVAEKAVLPVEQSFAWQVLTAHAADVTGQAEAGRAAINLRKRRRRR